MKRIKQTFLNRFENKTSFSTDTPFILLCIAHVVLFYLRTVRSGIVTHDELAGIVSRRMGSFFDNLSFGRWGGILFTPLAYLQNCCNNMWTYRLFTLFGLLCSVCSFLLIVNHIFGKKIAGSFFLLFFLLAVFEPEHDGLFAFSFTYQLHPFFVFLSLFLFIKYLENGRKMLRNASAVIFLLGCMSYEAGITYILLFFLTAVLYETEKKKLNAVKIIRDLFLHILLTFLYVLSWIIVGMITGAERGDASVGTGVTLTRFLVIVSKLSIGMFPLNYRPFDIKDCFDASLSNLFRWVLIILTVLYIIKLIKDTDTIRSRHYFAVTAFCLSGMILPCIPFGFAERFVELIVIMGCKSYGVSYYSYFFLILWLLTTGITIYTNTGYKKYLLIAGGMLLAFIAELVALGNDFQVAAFKKDQKRYELFDEFIRSDSFKDIPSGSVIYTPDYSGIHNNIDSLSEYANFIAGTDVSFVNDITNNDPDYILRFDSDKEALSYKAYEKRIQED